MPFIGSSFYPQGVPSATIYLDGLLSFVFDGKRLCTVAANNTSNQHQLSVRVGKVQNGVCTPLNISFPQGFREMEIRVINPAQLDGVYAYTGQTITSSGDNQPRATLATAVDLEALHGKALQKDASTLSPRFYIDNGIFAASYVTQTQFQVKRPGDTRTPGGIASVIAADIFLGPGGEIRLITSGAAVQALGQTSGVRYEIAITNNCRGCNFVFNDPDRTRRNDFFLHYNAIRLPQAEVSFELAPVPGSQDNRNPPPEGICLPSGPFDTTDERLVDSTPCAPVGYGQSSGIP
jgi:hypothetical protein